jgi:nicotinamidase-related amidase
MDKIGTWKKGFEKYPHLVPEYRLEPDKTALLIIDVQNRAVKPEYGALASLLQETHPQIAEYFLARAEHLVVPNISRLLDFFRSNHLRVIFLTIGPTLPDGADWISPISYGYGVMERQTGKRSLHPVGTPAHNIIDELKPTPGELVVNKTSSSPFSSTGIDASLHALGVDTLICAGLATNACVDLTARDAADRGYKVTIVDDACVTMDQEMHDSCLRIFAVFLGNVRTTQEVTEELSASLRKKVAHG